MEVPQPRGRPSTSLIVLITINPKQITLLTDFFESLPVLMPGEIPHKSDQPDKSHQPHQPRRRYYQCKLSLRFQRGKHHDRNPSSNPATPTTSSRVSGAGNQTYQLATALHGAHNRISFYGNLLHYFPALPPGELFTRYQTVILVAVQGFVHLPLDFGRPDPGCMWGAAQGWDGQYKYWDAPEKRPVDYSVIMMYNVKRKERKVAVTKGVTVNEAWVRQVMWMCGFEDDDAEPELGTMVEEDGKGKGTRVKGRKPVGEMMKTEVWNGTTEYLDAGDWQEVAAGVSRYELIRAALEELRGDVEGWLSP
ncbi:hypothetical protein QBC32DRAFT_312081 [Pseudoneurospora amorphoporcata]|uniref:Uncharacterized protein n=1 Tax=Pseudoneurospora amorphoporcata TaxID=241081 RepID=A0AAN6P2F1_9PEZI|nr:hypothetical protein QBC32DRAFT_312081 [Pseudoneurospora amorphoporcata]